MNTIKLNLIDYEVVKELRKIDKKLVMFGLCMTLLLCDNLILSKSSTHKCNNIFNTNCIKSYHIHKTFYNYYMYIANAADFLCGIFYSS